MPPSCASGSRPVPRSPAAFAARSRSAAVGAEEAAASAAERAVELVAEGLRTKEVTKHLVAEFGISRNDAYNLAMEAAR